MSVSRSDKSWLNRLRAGVYLAPDLPSDLFESILEYLKTTLDLNYTSLIYESTESNTAAQIENHEVDLAWVSFRKYFELVEAKKCCRLLPISTVHLHSKLSQARDGVSFGCYSDVVVHSTLKSQVKELYDLRGHRWAYTSPHNYSGHGITIEKLKALGENANFFGDYVASQSNRNSLELLLNRNCDGAAVDSNVLRLFLQQNPHFRKDLHVLTSWGPLPPYPILVNSHIGAEAEKLIEGTLLEMHHSPRGNELLSKYGVVKFAPNLPQNYSFLTSEFVKKPRSTSNIAMPNKPVRSKLAHLTTNQFESPYY